MKNFAAVLLIVFESYILFSGFSTFCPKLSCMPAKFEDFYLNFPVVEAVDYEIDSESNLYAILKLKNEMSDTEALGLALFLDDEKTDFDFQNGRLKVPADSLTSDVQSYFVWRGVQSPGFVLKKPYLSIDSISYEGMGDESLFFAVEGNFYSNLMVSYSYGETFSVLYSEKNEDGTFSFSVPARPGNLTLLFKSGEIESEQISVFFYDSKESAPFPYIEKVKADSGFMAGADFLLEGKNLNSISVDSDYLDLIFSGDTFAKLRLDTNVDPGQKINFKLLTRLGFTNSVTISAYDLKNSVDPVPLINSIINKGKGIYELHGEFFPEKLEDINVLLDGEILEVVSTTKTSVKVKAVENVEAGIFNVVRASYYKSDDYAYVPAGVMQICDPEESYTCIFIENI